MWRIRRFTIRWVNESPGGLKEMTEALGGLEGKAFDFESDYGREYDRFIRQIIPGYDSFFEICLAMFSGVIGENGKVLVAGCGTGAELDCFARNKPGWKMTGVDLSGQMVDIARKKLEASAREIGFEPEIEWIVGDVASLNHQGEFDAIACNLVLHFIPGLAGKLEFLKALRSLLRPGGILILMDACWEKKQAFHTWMRAWWVFASARGLSARKWASFREDFERGLHPLPKAEQEKMVGLAGFEEVFPFWSSLHHLAVVARNPFA